MGITSAREDVPLKHAMLAWTPANQGTPEAMVVRWPDRQGLAGALPRTAGACWGNPGPAIEGDDRDWPRMSTDARMALILGIAWQAVIRDGVPAVAVHQALCLIPEFRERMTPDMLSDPEVE